MESPFAQDRKLNMPTLERVRSEDIKHIEELNQWKMCCCESGTDSRLIKFLAQYIILLTLFLFCLTMLWNANTCDESSGYLSLLSVIIGIALPQPK